MAEIRTYELNNWYIAKDADNSGIARGYDSNAAPDAIPCVIPSIIQQYFPEYHGVVFYFCRFTPGITKAPADRLLVNYIKYLG